MLDWLQRILGRQSLASPQPAAANDPAPDILEELRGYIERDVAAGFPTRDEIIESAADVLGDEADPEFLRREAERITDEAIATHAARQATWPRVTDCDRLDAAFTELESQGVIARQNWTCCGNCGVSEIWDEIENAKKSGLPARGYAFFHMQDTERAVEGEGVYLNYGSVEQGEEAAVAVGNEIVDRLNRHGLQTNWNGSINQRIGVSLDWKRRRA